MRQTTLLADRLLDGTGSAVLRDAFVQISDGEIVHVGRQEDLGSEANSARNLGEVTLLPGLINMHAHLTCSAGLNVLDDALHDSYETKMIRAMTNARSSIESGVTTIRDCGSLNSIIFSIREASLQAMMPSPHILASGEVLTSTGGHCHFFGVECDSVADVTRAVRRQVKMGADFIKVMATGGRLTPNSDPVQIQFESDEIDAITRNAARLGKFVAAHCLGTSGVTNAVRASVRTIEHCYFTTENGFEFDPELAEAIAERGIYVCPTIGNAVRYREYLLDRGDREAANEEAREQQLQNHRRLRDFGVKLVSGNDAGMPLTRFDDFQLDLEILVEKIGMLPTEAIHTATGQAAEAIGSREFGVLGPRKRADIIAVSGDASANIRALRNVVFVMKSGTIVLDHLSAQRSIQPSDNRPHIESDNNEL
jgi:imidazolonepropionase-like amidohydrolase